MFYYTLHPTSAKTRKHVQRNFLMPTLAYLFFGYYNMKAEAALLNLKAEADKITSKFKKKAHNRVVPYDNEDAETNRLVLV